MMKDYILLLPIIYLFHDFEEIIGFGWFFRKNPQIFTEHPKLAEAYRDYTNEGMAIGVFEQLILFFGGLSLLAYYFPCRVLFGAWFGMMIGFTAHLFVHIFLCIYIRKYIPSFITSIICLPLCMMILARTAGMITFEVLTTVSVCAVIPLMMINMKLIHIGMFRLGKKLSG